MLEYSKLIDTFELFRTVVEEMLNMKLKSGKTIVRIMALAMAAVMLAAALAIFDPAKPRKTYAAQTGMITGKEIYSENFDATENGKLPEGWELNHDLKSGGSAAVKDGALIIDATGVELGKVLLPAAIWEGNVTFEADVSFLSTRDTSRWMSLVVRQQDSDQNYYHMCVRRGTSAGNGVEFAIRSPGNWNVMNTASSKVELGLNNPVHIKISVADDMVYEYVGNDRVLISDGLMSIANYFKTGRLGIQANFSVIKVDNIKVSECSYVVDPDAVVEDKYASHKFLVTPVISQAATVAIAESASELDRLIALDQRPENIILHVSGDGNVVSSGGKETIGTLSEVTEKVFRKMIPVYYVSSEEAADAINEYLKQSKFVDCLLMSDNAELMQAMRKRNKKIGGVMDWTSVGADQLTPGKLDELIYATNEATAKTAVISEEIALKDNVEYMQHRLITVWVSESAAADDEVMLHNSIQSGANGIVTDKPEKLIEAYKFYKNDPYVLVRNPMVIGHRGLPSSAPENTIESAKEAIAAGVDCIELDVRISSDGKIYIYHDNDLNSLTTGSGTVNSHTSAELDSYFVTKSGGYGTFNKYKKVKLPSLDDYFAALKDEDVMFFIEIKEANIEKPVAELVEKYGLKNRCCMISFVNSAVTAFPKSEPGMSVGQLMGTPSDSSYESKVKSIINTIVPENATFNASGVNDKRLVRALMYRGITAWPWTYNHTNTRDAYLLGAGGITTDFCNTVSYVPVKIDIGGNYSLKLNPAKEGLDSLTFSPSVQSRMGELDLTAKYKDGTPVNVPEIVVLDGAEHVKIEGNKVTALSDGTVRLMYRLLASTDPDKAPDVIAGNTFALYTQVVTINIDSEAEVGPDDLPSTSAPTPQKQNANGKSVEIIIITAAAVIVIAICCVLLAVFGKKKKAAKKD